jgi:hypothetical protein
MTETPLLTIIVTKCRSLLLPSPVPDPNVKVDCNAAREDRDPLFPDPEHRLGREQGRSKNNTQRTGRPKTSDRHDGA